MNEILKILPYFIGVVIGLWFWAIVSVIIIGNLRDRVKALEEKEKSHKAKE